MWNKLYVVFSAFRVWFFVTAIQQGFDFIVHLRKDGWTPSKGIPHVSKKIREYCLSTGIWTMSWRKIAVCKQKVLLLRKADSWPGILHLCIELTNWTLHYTVYCTFGVCETMSPKAHCPGKCVLKGVSCHLGKTECLTGGLHFFKELHPSEGHILWREYCFSNERMYLWKGCSLFLQASPLNFVRECWH